MAVTALLKLAGFTNGLRYVDIFHQALAHAFSQPREIAIVCDPKAADTQALLSVVRSGYQPFRSCRIGVCWMGKPQPTCATRHPLGEPSPARHRSLSREHCSCCWKHVNGSGACQLPTMVPLNS